MPVRPILSRPDGPVMRVYDRFSFGDLLDVSMIDGRQYRSREACYAPPDKGRGHLETDASCPERREEGRTMMGFAQEAWLATGLARSKAQWNLIAQDVLMAQLRQKNQNGNFAYWTDDWDGYPAGRRRLLARIAQTKVSNPVVIGGDIHAFFANDLRVDFDDPEFAGGRHRIRRHLHHLGGAALRPVHGGAARQSSCPLLREPQARLCQRRSRRQADDDPDARRLRRDGPTGQRLDLEDLRGGKRQAGGGGGVRGGPIPPNCDVFTVTLICA